MINSILDTVSTSDQLELLAEFYETTLRALEEARPAPPRETLLLAAVEFTVLQVVQPSAALALRHAAASGSILATSAG